MCKNIHVSLQELIYFSQVTWTQIGNISQQSVCPPGISLSFSVFLSLFLLYPPSLWPSLSPFYQVLGLPYPNYQDH